MRKHLLNLIENSTTNKYSFLVKQDDALCKWVLNETAHLPVDTSFLERIYLAMYPGTDTCENGKYKTFSGNLKLGFRFCGVSTTCACAKANHSLKISQAKSKMSQEQIADTNGKRKATMIKKFGVEFNSQLPAVKQKKVDTCIAKYGVATNLLAAESQQKIKQTLISRFGVENPMQAASILEKAQATNLEKYGNICSAQAPTMRAAMKASHLEKFGVGLFHGNRYTKDQTELLTDRGLIEKEVNEHGVLATAKKFSIHPDRITFRLDSWGIPYNKSFTQIEDFVKKILDKHGIEYSYRNRKIIAPYEMDFVIESKKIAIEVGGLYWHSEKHVDAGYHLMKLNKANAAGYTLITIFSDEIEKTPGIVKSRIEHILGMATQDKIHARKCIIREIDSAASKEFLIRTHIQGNAASTVKLGAFYNDQLVAVMTFSGNRKFTGDKSEYYELVRFSTSGPIAGIASKMFTYFIRSYSPMKVVSYADRRWSEGKVYNNLGFKLTRTSTPNYWYSLDCNTRLHRYNFTKSSLVKAGADSTKTEKVLMQEAGYVRIWDCGTLRFEWAV